MRSSIFPLFVALSLMACSGSESVGDGKNPLATVSGFCQEWAVLACNDEVVAACNAPDADACQQSQTDFCEDLVPSSEYDSRRASDCLRAVEEAYEDADLNAEELLVVVELGGACAAVLSGSADEGDDCSEDAECNTSGGYACVQRADGGTCQVPEEVEAGRSCRSESAVCVDGFYCDGSNCVERLPEDEACNATFECAADLRCEATAGAGGGSGEAGCVPREPNSGVCETHDDCESGYCWLLDGSPGECVGRIILGRNEPLCDTLR